VIVTAQQLIDAAMLLVRKFPRVTGVTGVQVAIGERGITFTFVGRRFLLMDVVGELTVFEWDDEAHQHLFDTTRAKWMTGVLNGLVRDNDGNMVAA
jgi:hypothetical protein